MSVISLSKSNFTKFAETFESMYERVKYKIGWNNVWDLSTLIDFDRFFFQAKIVRMYQNPFDLGLY